ncbi:MAG: ribosome silencing factor [Lentisphaeria bacterium]|nr:ribosome silencing factor [Lentisphaeria bacterium]
MSEEKEAKKLSGARELAAFCEKVLYEHKAENIIRFDMEGLEWAQADCYIVCTGISAPHIGALAERVVREVRAEYAVRPSAVDGDPQSKWIIVDFGNVMIHVLTTEARERYQLEELWNDAPKEDCVRRLEEEHRRRSPEKE